MIEQLDAEKFAYVGGIEALAASAQIQANDDVETFDTCRMDWIQG